MNFLGRISSLKQSMSSKKPRFEDQYELQTNLGSGSFATVYACVSKMDQDALPVAVKVFDRGSKRGLRREFRGERELLRILTPNEHCVQMVDAFESSRFCHIVMEKCGMSVQDAFLQSCTTGVNELDLAHLFKCMLKGIEHLHDCGIVHRDIKPANLLLAQGSNCSLSGRPLVKICDLGLAAKLPPRGLDEVCGTAPYMAPEMLTKKSVYREGVDVWSTGVAAYLMLFGNYPYGEACYNSAMVKDQIRDGKRLPTFRARSGFPQPSPAASKFVSSLLARDPRLRADTSRALASPYITQLSQPSHGLSSLPSFGPTLSHVHSITQGEPKPETPVVHDLHDDSNEDEGSDSTNCGHSGDEASFSRSSTCESALKVTKL